MAALCGKTALADPASKALCEARAQVTGSPVFALRIADFFNEPVVDEHDLPANTGKAGVKIGIPAHADLTLTGVAMTIRTTARQVLEQGAAVQGSDSAWNYATTALSGGQNVSIDVTATDRPGHKPTRTQAKWDRLGAGR